MDILLCSIVCVVCFFAGAYVSGGIGSPLKEARAKRSAEDESAKTYCSGNNATRDMTDDIAKMLNYSVSSRMKEKENEVADGR